MRKIANIFVVVMRYISMAIVKSPLFVKIWGKVGTLNFRVRKNKKVELSIERIPSNPRSDKQVAQRSKYRDCYQQWNNLSQEEKQQYEERAKQLSISGYNLFMQECLKTAIKVFNYEIIIDNSTNPSELTDYQVLLEISNDEQFFTDCENNQTYLEFYDEDQQTLLNHYVEFWDTTNHNARIWIKIPQIPASSTKKIYLKINKSRTEDLSNPESVFDFYDDFEGTELDTSKWSNSKAGSYNITNSKITFNGGCGSGWCYIFSKANFHVPFVIEARWNPSGNWGMLGWLKQREELFYCTYADDNGMFTYEWFDGKEHHYGNYNAQGYNNIEAIHKLVIISNTEFKHYVKQSISTVTWTLLKHATDLDRSLVEGAIVLGEWYNQSGSTFEWVRVRKFTDQEPTVTYTRL